MAPPVRRRETNSSADTKSYLRIPSHPPSPPHRHYRRLTIVTFNRYPYLNHQLPTFSTEPVPILPTSRGATAMINSRGLLVFFCSSLWPFWNTSGLFRARTREAGRAMCLFLLPANPSIHDCVTVSSFFMRGSARPRLRRRPRSPSPTHPPSPLPLLRPMLEKMPAFPFHVI